MRRIRSERGQTVVEFTLMLPFLLFMMFALAEFGYGFYTQVAVRNAAAEGARFAAVGNLPGTCVAGTIQNRARQASNNVVPCAAVTVGYHSPTNGIYGRGSGVAVRINHTYTAITPLPAIANGISWGLIPATWNLSACADARLESRPPFPANPPVQEALSCG